MDVRSKAIEQALLARVADRITCRIAAHDEIQPNGRAPRADVRHREVNDLPALEALDLLM